MANHILNMDFTEFIGAEIIKHENPDGYDEEGVFIPLAKNDIKRGKKGTLYAQFYIMQKKNNFYFNQTHYVIPKYSQKYKKEMQEYGYKVPYIGHVKPCWDKNINKLTRSYQEKEGKGFVKMSSLETEDKDE